MNSALLPCVVNILANLGIQVAPGSPLGVLNEIVYIPQYTLIPRFILGLRVLYAHDVQGRHGSNIDTAFGLGSSSGHDAAGSVIVFAAGGQNEEEEQGEE